MLPLKVARPARTPIPGARPGPDPQPMPTDATSSPLPRIARGLALSALTLVACLVLLEAGLRWVTLGSLRGPQYAYYLQMFAPHPTRGWALKPDSEAWLRTPDYSVLHATNSRGFRDVEHAFEKPPGTYRVVVLGDSFIEGGQVDLEQSFTRVLEAELADALGRPVEVINLGTSGYGQVQELVVLREEGLRYDPDLVLVAFFPENDLTNNHPELERYMGWFPGRPFARVEDGEVVELYQHGEQTNYMNIERQAEHLARKERRRPFWERTLLFDRWQRAIADEADGQSMRNADPNVWLGVYATRFDPALEPRRETTAEEYARSWDEVYAELGPILAEIREAAGGVDTVVFTVPAMSQVDGPYGELVRSEYPTLELDYDRVNRRLAKTCEELDLELVDLLDAFRAAQAEGRHLLHHVEDRHWNAAGHRLAAMELADYIVRTRFAE